MESIFYGVCVICVQITPECGVLFPREGDESSSTGDSSNARYPTADAFAQSGVDRGQSSVRSASAPLPSLPDHGDTDDVSNLRSISLIIYVH